MAVIASASLRSRSRRRRSPTSPTDGAAAGRRTCSSCAWLKRVGRSDTLAAWSTRDDDHGELGGIGSCAAAAARAAASAAPSSRWPMKRTDSVDAAMRGGRRMRRLRPSPEEDEEQEQQHRRRRPQLRRRQQERQQQREATDSGHFQHHPDDIGWYIRQYCADRAARLRGKLRGGGTSGLPLSAAAAECSSWSCSTTTSAAAKTRSDEASVRSGRSHSSAPHWQPRPALDAAEDAGSRKNARDSISQHTNLSESAAPNSASQKGAAIDQLVEKLMRRQVSGVNCEQPEPFKPQLAPPPSSTNSIVCSAESDDDDDERQPIARSAAAKRRLPSPHGKVLLPATAIDVLERFGLGGPAQARDRARPPSAADDRGPARGNRLLPACAASGDALGYLGTMPLPPQAPRPPFKAKTIAMASSDRGRTRAYDDARASAALSLDEALLAIAPDNRPFFENKTKPSGARVKFGGSRLQPRAAAAALHTVAVSNGVPSGAVLRDRSSGGWSRQQLEPATLGQPPPDHRRRTDCEESLFLNMLYKPLVACFLNGSDRVASHVGDLPGQLAQACLVDYSGYWSVQSP